MNISYRHIRATGFSILILLYVIGCFIAYTALKKNSNSLLSIVNVEQLKVDKWYDLSKVLNDTKDSINNYSFGKIKVVSPALLLINNAFSQIEAIKVLTVDEEEKNTIKEIEYGVKMLRQASIGYQYEVKLGHQGGTSAKELEEIMVTQADNLSQLCWAAVDYIGKKIEIKNKEVIKSTNLTKLFLILSIFFGITTVIIFSLIMNMALAKPIHTLVEATKLVAKGDLTHAIEVKSTDEIGDLTEAFNQMIKDLKTSKSLLVDKDYVDSIIANMGEALIVVGPDGRIKTVNRATLDLLDYKKEELINQPVSKIFTNEEILNELEDGACLLSDDFKIIEVNDAFLEKTGFKKKDIINQYCYKVMHGTDNICQLPDHKCPVLELTVNKNSHIELHRHFNSNGEEYLTNVLAVPLKEKDKSYYLHLTKNVTEEELKRKLPHEDENNIRRFTFKLNRYLDRLIDEKILEVDTIEKLTKLEKLSAHKNLSIYYKTKYGNSIPVSFSGSAMRDKNGNLVGAIGVARDMRQVKKLISDLEKAKETIEESKINFANIIDKNVNSIIVLEKNGIMRFMNSSAKILFGHKIEDLLDDNFGLPIMKKDVDEIDIVLKNGEIGIGEMRLVETKWENKNSYLLLINDITEQKKYQKEIQRLSTAMEQSTTNIMFFSNIKGIIEYINPMYEKFTGYSKNEIIGAYFETLLGEITDNGNNDLFSIIKGDKKWRGIIKNKKKDGDTYWAYCTISPIKDSEGKITHFLGVQEDITEKVISEKKIQFLSSFDEMTSVYNRSGFISLLNNVLSSNEKQNGIFMVVNIDYFRAFNESYGHKTGDECLRKIADMLKNIFDNYLKNNLNAAKKETYIIGRIGGDEFVIYCPHINREEVPNIAEKIRKDIENATFTNTQLHLTVSIGIVLFPEDGLTSKELLTKADVSVYRAKERGKNCYHVYSAEDHDIEKIHSKIKLKENVESAIKNNHIEVWYQPILNLAYNKITHYEGLARIRDGKDTILSPKLFIEVAERFGLIGSIDRIVAKEIMKKQVSMYQKNQDLSFSINLSGKDIEDSDLLAFLKSNISELKTDPNHLIFEITETAAIHNINNAIKFINELVSIGCRFSLDDFGSGFSSFFYLKDIPVDYIKIDGSFIRRLHQSLKNQLFVKAIVDVAKGMGIKTVAEFVEKEETLELLKNLGVDYAQGYLIGKPLPELLSS